MSDFNGTIVGRQELISRIDAFVSKEQPSFFGVLIIDLNDFHHINYQYGYDCGDAVISMMGERLITVAKTLRCVMRTGANEFVVLLPNLLSPFLANLALQKCLKLASQPFFLGREVVHATARAGAGVLELKRGIDPALLLIAEQALVLSRDSVDQLVLLYHYDDAVYENYRLRDQLDLAIEAGDFDVYFQPKMDLALGVPCGAEALIRWRAQDGSFVPPDVFIPLAEQSSRIDDITNWVVNNAVRKANALPKRWQHLSIAINLSGRCFSRESIVSDLQKYLAIWGIDPKRIIFEVTETVFMSDLKLTNNICNQLRDGLGVQVSIDDFGKGFSSLDYFRHIPADELKIDRSFVESISYNKVDKNIVDCITKLAKGSGLDVVVEGIEDEATAIMAKSIGCDRAQGYFYTPPLPFDKFVQWLDNYGLSC